MIIALIALFVVFLIVTGVLFDRLSDVEKEIKGTNKSLEKALKTVNENVKKMNNHVDTFKEFADIMGYNVVIAEEPVFDEPLFAGFEKRMHLERKPTQPPTPKPLRGKARKALKK